MRHGVNCAVDQCICFRFNNRLLVSDLVGNREDRFSCNTAHITGPCAAKDDAGISDNFALPTCFLAAISSRARDG